MSASHDLRKDKLERSSCGWKIRVSKMLNIFTSTFSDTHLEFNRSSFRRQTPRDIDDFMNFGEHELLPVFFFVYELALRW